MPTETATIHRLQSGRRFRSLPQHSFTRIIDPQVTDYLPLSEPLQFRFRVTRAKCRYCRSGPTNISRQSHLTPVKFGLLHFASTPPRAYEGSLILPQNLGNASGVGKSIIGYDSFLVATAMKALWRGKDTN